MGATFIRAFFAVDLSPACKQQLGAQMEVVKRRLQKKLKPRSFRWVKPQNFHLTLRFLGPVAEDAIACLLRQASEELAGCEAFDLRWGALEWFPSSEHPQVLSLQAMPHVPLAELAQALGKGAVRLGYAREDHPFRAHLTLARVDGLRKLERGLLQDFCFEALPPVFVKEVVLFRSELGSGGSVYTPLASIALEP